MEIKDKKKKLKENLLIPPHGSKLVNLVVDKEGENKEELEISKSLYKVKLSTLEFSDLIMLGIGAFSPLEGFMNKADYQRVLEDMRLNSNILWPIPITLSLKADNIKKGEKIALISPHSDEIVGQMDVEDIFSYNKTREAKSIFGTVDRNHPGVNKIYGRGDYYLGGKVKVFSEGEYPKIYPEYARPSEVRKIFAGKGWKTIVAFQTRNPIHRSHEYLTKVALEVADGLLIHPIVGELKEGDIPAEVRMNCYKKLIELYYPHNRVVLKVYPMEMRYAGPREAILHSIIRQNFGCSHIIIGRDHAGIGNFYGPFEAQEIFNSISCNDLLIRPIKMDWTFYCKKCDSMASSKTCPHSDEYHKVISGTRLRKMLEMGQYPPEYITRKEISDVLIEYYLRRGKDGKNVYRKEVVKS